jgi:hypothetical protein
MEPLASARPAGTGRDDGKNIGSSSLSFGAVHKTADARKVSRKKYKERQQSGQHRNEDLS